jgi:potassium large conductance calcium-activated channel subfamily M alpha protein 1
MYKTIEANYKNVSIVTELAQMSAIAFIINESGQKDSEQANYFASKPFAAGEIFVGSLLNSLMCQAFYNPKMTDLLDQFIMGSASTSAEVYKLYQKMNLAMCSLNIMEVPKGCQDMTYASVFEFCVKRNQVPIGVFRRHNDDEFAQSTGTEHQDNPGKSKPHVWLHPPKNLELSVHDELFILCEKNPKGETTLKNMENFGTFKAKNDVTKTQDNNMLKLTKLEG